MLLRLRQRSAAALPQSRAGKLKPRFYGPYRVTELINDVAVRLELPVGARIHDVFHIGLLKKFHGPPPDAPPALPPLRHGAIAPEPERAVRFCLARGVCQALFQWKGESPASATWEDIDVLRDKYPTLQLEDELSLEGGEMSCGRRPTLGGAEPGTCAVQRNGLARARTPIARARRMRLRARLVARIGKIFLVVKIFG